MFTLACIFSGCGSVADWLIVFITLGAFLFSIYQYEIHKERKRVDVLTKFNIRYTTDKNICSVVEYLETLEDNRAAPIEKRPKIHELEMFMRFFEEIYCLVKSEALKRNIVYYMFGHYLIVFDDNKDKLPIELEYDKGFWTLFRESVKMMREARDELYSNKINSNVIDESKIDMKKIEL